MGHYCDGKPFYSPGTYWSSNLSMAKIFSSVRVALLIVFKYLRRNQGAALLILVTLVVLAFLQIRFNLFYKSNTIRLGMVGTYQEHDIPLVVTRLLSDSLVEADQNGHIKTKMVKGWEVNNDATMFKFKLKDNLFWADGSRIVSSDISINIPDVEVTTPDDNTLQFKLKDSYSPFPSLLTKPVFKKGTDIGTGPYRITKIEKSRIFITKLTLEPENKTLPTVYVRFYPTEETAQTGFNLGEVSALLGVGDIDFAKSNPDIKTLSFTDYGKIVTVLYNTQDSLLSSRSLRQAFSFQAPKIAGFEEANNPFPKTSWAYDPSSKKYLDNSEEANAALGRAKTSLDAGKLKGEITLTAVPNLENVGNDLISAWKKLGLNTTLRIEPGIPQNFQMLLIMQSIPDDPDQYFLWHSTQSKTNLSNYSSARVDKDLEDGRKTTNETDRKAKYSDFQHSLLEDAPATFLYFPKYHVVYLKKVEGNLKKLLPLQLPNSIR